MPKIKPLSTITTFIIIFLAILSLNTLNTAYHSHLQDFSYYIGAAENLLDGKNPYYTNPTQVYPPASLFLFIVFHSLPVPIAKLLWTTISLLSFFLALRIFITHFLRKPVNLPISLIITLLFLQTFPVKYALAQGQINFLVFLGLALFFRFISQNKNHLAGLTLSLIVILKFNPVFLLLYLLITRNTKPLLAFFLYLITLNLLIDLIFPIGLNKSFLHSIINMSSNYSGYYYNTSLAALSIRLLHQPFARFLNLFLTGLFWLSTLILSRKRPHSPLTFSLFIITILLTSPITWQHYLFWTIPAFLTLIPLKTNIVRRIGHGGCPFWSRLCKLDLLGHFSPARKIRLSQKTQPEPTPFKTRAVIKTGRDRCPFWSRLCKAKKHGFYVLEKFFAAHQKPAGAGRTDVVRPKRDSAKRPLLITLLTISFLLINFNLKNPQSLPMEHPLYSHATIGLLLLYLLLVFKHQRIRRQPH